MRTITEVCEAFKHKRVEQGRNIESTGYKLISFSTVIAQWIGGKLIINATRYSNITDKHQAAIIWDKRYKPIYVYNVPRNTTNLLEYIQCKI